MQVRGKRITTVPTVVERTFASYYREPDVIGGMDAFDFLAAPLAGRLPVVSIVRVNE